MNTPLFASGVTQNSRSRSKSAYDAAVRRNPVPESAATAPSCNCQLASPTCVQPARLVPSNNVRQVASAAALASGSVLGAHPEAATAMTRTMSFARTHPPSLDGRATPAEQPPRVPAELSSTRQRRLFETERSLRRGRRRRRRDPGGFVRVQSVVERVQADAESLGGRTLVAIEMLERAHDELALDVANRPADREPLLPVRLIERAVEALGQTQHRLVRIRHDRGP